MTRPEGCSEINRRVQKFAGFHWEKSTRHHVPAPVLGCVGGEEEVEEV